MKIVKRKFWIDYAMTPKLFKCAQCSRVYFGKADRAQHVRQVHTGGVIVTQPKQPVHSPETVTASENVRNETDKGDSRKTSKAVVERTVRRTTSSRPFQCTMCTSAFNNKPTLTVHYGYKHSSERPYKCDQCSCTFKSACNLRAHTTIVHGSDVQRFACEIDGCTRRFKQKGNRNTHMAGVHGRAKGMARVRHRPLKEQSQCAMVELDTKCDDNKSTLDDPEETKPNHPKGTNLDHPMSANHTCHLCAKVFRQRCNLFIHIRQAHHNERQFRCTACRQSFKQRVHLKSHVRSMHSTIRPFLCSFDSCGKTFKLKGHLTSHKRIHLGLQRHKCQHCAYRVDTLRGMKNHMKLIHPAHVTDIPTTTMKIDEAAVSSKEHLRCTVCAYVGQWPYRLTQHMRQHTGERPYNCERCDKTFVRKCTLDRHMAKLHSGEDGERTTERLPKQRKMDGIPIDSKRHKCTSCSYEGRWASSLTNHMQVHTERRFKCDRCEKTYCRKSSLNRHMTEAHSLDEEHNSGNDDQVVSVHFVDLERLKSCDVSSVTSVDHLDKHSELSVGGNAFNCPECDYATDEKQKMRDHYMTVHLIG